MIIIKFVDSLSSGIIYREEKFDKDVDVEEIKKFIDNYKESDSSWQLDEMVDSCISELKLKTHPMEEKVIVEI